MYSFFYPENNSRFSSAEEHVFDTIKKAIAYWKNRHQIWEDITTHGGEPAFMQPGSDEHAGVWWITGITRPVTDYYIIQGGIK